MIGTWYSQYNSIPAGPAVAVQDEDKDHTYLQLQEIKATSQSRISMMVNRGQEHSHMTWEAEKQEAKCKAIQI